MSIDSEGITTTTKAWPVADYVIREHEQQHVVSLHPTQGGTMPSPIGPIAVESGEPLSLGWRLEPQIR